MDFTEFTISTDQTKLDLELICNFLQSAYWASNRSRETILKSLEHSLCFGLYHHRQQIGMARVITDFATFAYLCDVFVTDDYRGRGLGKFLMQTVLEFLGAGDSVEDVLEAYPSLQRVDVLAALQFSSRLMANHFTVQSVA